MQVAIPVVYRQVGWMPCIACSDAHKMHFGGKLGQMWLGYKSNGLDDWVQCPVCGGEGRTPRYKTLDARTLEEIDYEGRDEEGNRLTFIPAEPVATGIWLL